MRMRYASSTDQYPCDTSTPIFGTHRSHNGHLRVSPTRWKWQSRTNQIATEATWLPVASSLAHFLFWAKNPGPKIELSLLRPHVVPPPPSTKVFCHGENFVQDEISCFCLRGDAIEWLFGVSLESLQVSFFSLSHLKVEPLTNEPFPLSLVLTLESYLKISSSTSWFLLLLRDWSYTLLRNESLLERGTDLWNQWKKSTNSSVEARTWLNLKGTSMELTSQNGHWNPSVGGACWFSKLYFY